MAVRKQVPRYYNPKKWFLLMVGHLGLTPLSTQSINVRITQRAADTRDPAGRAVIIYFFLRNKQLLFILVLETDQGNNGVVRGLWPVQPGFYLCLPHHEPSCVFFLLKMASPVLLFLKKYLNEAYLLCQPYQAANLSRRGEFHSVCPENGLSVMRNGRYIFKTLQTGNQFHFKILNSIDFYAWTIIWILYLYKFIFQISLNVTRNFRIKNS